jgi:hypothetical protein
MIIHCVSDWPGVLAAAFVDEGEEAQGQRRSAWSTTDEETEPGFFAPVGQRYIADLTGVLPRGNQRNAHSRGG